LKLVEWPEKVAGLLPPADLDLYLTPPELQDGKADEADEADEADGAGQPRQVRAVANAAAGLALIDAWQPTLNATEASHV
jgi:tRNA threonylcarbamoyladenosine biosynthesis protein TsaE